MSDTFTLILPAPTSCTPLTIVNQPSSVAGCVIIVWHYRQIFPAPTPLINGR
ncbi:MAG: hypothetical protein IPI36_02505 [Chitinophagaceae bacterium]|nr:hypothetical protein [Chitinophagaceae bacterium]